MNSNAPASRGSEWISSWDPNNEATWDSQVAWRTLWVTTYTLMLGFITWYLVSAVAPKLGGLGFKLSTEEKYWLAAMPGLAAGFLRLVWTFLPPLMGTRRLVTYSTALLLIPLVGWGVIIQDPTTPYWVLMTFAFLAGIGGGVFSGFMPSTSYFFPKSKQGTALGVQAGIGNFGVSVVQFVTPWVVGFGLIGATTLGASHTFKTLKNGAVVSTKAVWYQNAAWFWVPFVIVGVILAWTMLRSVPVKAKGVAEQLDIFKEKHNWIMTYLYVMTFGTFSGLAAAFGLLISNNFPDRDPLKYAFLGALVGAGARVLAGPLADKVGGGILTVVSGIGIAIGAIATVNNLKPGSFNGFMWSMLFIFFFTGVGNASTFKQMPMIFEPRHAGGVIGWTAAIAAFGPFLFNVSFATWGPTAVFYFVTVFALVGSGIAWHFYARRGAEKPC